MKLDIYLFGFIIVFLGCNTFLTYKVLQSNSLEKKQKIYKLLLMWGIPYFGFFIVFNSISSQSDNKKNKKKNCVDGLSSDDIDI